jgi:hypothetical protein
MYVLPFRPQKAAESVTYIPGALSLSQNLFPASSAIETIQPLSDFASLFLPKGIDFDSLIVFTPG